ncbi:hypothetical protein N9K82_05285 [Gammaproteobacteria bacterium]|nr:hypothetical protein [Gammaproteobacteria bacterium]
MKHTLALALMVFGLVGCSELVDPPKYQFRDCITPTDKAYSWYGEYAKVEAYVKKAEGISGSSYVLWFPSYKSNNNIFAREIELSTKKVDYLKYCGAL